MEVEEDASNGIYPEWHTEQADETMVLVSSSEARTCTVNQAID